MGSKQECKYRHALPKGFVLKKDKPKKQAEEAVITIEELVETERAKLDSSKLTKITLTTFVAWKKKKLKERADAAKKEKDKKKKEYTSGNVTGMSGRDMFLMDPSIMSKHGQEDDEDEGEDFDLTREVQEEDMGVKVHEIKFDAYGIMDDGLDDSTDKQLAAAGGAAAVAVDEDLFDDEDLDDLEDELDNLEV